jgi:hypothetical protein
LSLLPKAFPSISKGRSSEISPSSKSPRRERRPTSSEFLPAGLGDTMYLERHNKEGLLPFQTRDPFYNNSCKVIHKIELGDFSTV